MIKRILTAALLGGAIALMGCSPASETTQNSASLIDTRVKAVLVYAEWCASCRVLDPKLQAVLPEYENRGVNFITLDYTKKDDAAFYAEAERYGVHKAVRGALGDSVKTGLLFLIAEGSDSASHTINMTHTQDDMRQRFDSALSQN